MTIGYNKPLYILPFDHRSSFEKTLFGWDGHLTAEQTARVAAAKQVVYEAFKLSLAQGVKQGNAGILVDPQFGDAILRDAHANGYITCLPAEKSGQSEFVFEDGDHYQATIEAYDPTFVKVLVRYNPEADEAMNRRQAARLRELSDYVHGSNGRYLMFELLVPETEEQSIRLDDDATKYDQALRPSLMMAAIKELQNAGVEADVWKIEGLDRREDCIKIAEVARRDGRDQVGCIILGRGSNADKVVEWLQNAAGVPGFIGFAVGRTTFWDPLVAYRDGEATAEKAAADIAANFLEWVRAFTEAENA
jgi:5-dehydro-2-deoxygluconokinase